jgi:hypothetical protein
MFQRISFRSLLPTLLGAVLLAGQVHAQERKTRIDVENYVIDVDINQRTQTLTAKTAVRFIPLDDNTTSATFELNNALNVSKILDQQNQQISASRSQQDFTVHLNFSQPLEKGKPVTLTFYYDGRLSGQEDSPVYGIKFAAIQNDYAFLLYPSRWFPVSGYTTDRYSAEINATVGRGSKVVASGIETVLATGEKNIYNFKFDRASFPGSIAVVKDAPATRVSSEGVTTAFYFRPAEQAMANAYGQEASKIVTHFSSLFGIPPYANLTIVETEAGAPNGYAAPGLIFLNPRAIGKEVSMKLLANQISRQWWGVMISPASRNHLWLSNGLASYSETLYAAQVNGPSALENDMRDTAVEALTVDNVPVAQAARLEDYSPELLALTGSKGAAVLHMLRSVIGDEKFFQTLKDFSAQYAWKSVTTDDFKKTAEKAAAQDLAYFFIQWIESSGAPEFKLEYTILRTQKGFRAMGKIAQDLDTFRMPVDLKIETEGNPEQKRVEVMGTSSEFSVDTFGKPKAIALDPDNRVLRFSNQMRVAVAIRRGEQFAEISEFNEALKEYQKALEANRTGSLAHYRIAEVFFLQGNYQSAANEFRETFNGDLQPKWIEVWSHINLGNIFDITGQRERAVNEYKQAERTKDNTQGALEQAAKYLKTPYERQKKAEN